MKLTREAKTGLIAIIVLAMTVWGFNYLKGKNILSPTDVYYVEYEHIEGIIESGAVYYRGYKVGSIMKIDFNSENPNSFIIKIVLEKKLNIPLNSKVLAKQSNPIASAKDLELIFSDEKTYHHSGDTLLPEYDPGFLSVLEPIQTQLEETITGITKTLKAVSTILDENTQNDIKATLSSVKELSNSLESMLGPHGDLTASLNNLESVTGTLNGKKESLGSAIDNMASITSSLDSANIGKTIVSLDSTLLVTHAILDKINNAEGTAGLLVNDSALYNNLASTTASLDSLLSDMKEHPKRYVHFSLFGKKN